MNRCLLLVVTMLFAALPAHAAEVPSGPEAGQPAPDFRLQDQKGEWHTLAGYKGGYLVLYFYPKNFTPGCTDQVCAFRDDIHALKKAGAKVAGVSLDDVKSHAEFAAKYSVSFPLLSDASQDTAKAYGVLASRMGFQYAKRETFLIGPDGTVVKRYRDVDPKENVKQVLIDLEAAKAG